MKFCFLFEVLCFQSLRLSESQTNFKSQRCFVAKHFSFQILRKLELAIGSISTCSHSEWCQLTKRTREIQRNKWLSKCRTLRRCFARPARTRRFGQIRNSKERQAHKQLKKSASMAVSYRGARPFLLLWRLSKAWVWEVQGEMESWCSLLSEQIFAASRRTLCPGLFDRLRFPSAWCKGYSFC